MKSSSVIDVEEQKLTKLANKWWGAKPEDQFQLALYKWKKIEPDFQSPPRNDEERKAFLNSYSKIKTILPLLKKAADKHHIEAIRSYAGLLFFQINFRFYRKNNRVLLSPTEWVKECSTHKKTIKSIINLLNNPAHKDDPFSQEILGICLASGDSKNIRHCFEIIKNLSDKGQQKFQFSLAYLIIVAKELNYSPLEAKQYFDELNKRVMSGEFNPTVAYYYLLRFPEILNELKKYSILDGKQLLANLELDSLEAMKNIFFFLPPTPLFWFNDLPKLLCSIKNLEEKEQKPSTIQIMTTLQDSQITDKTHGDSRVNPQALQPSTQKSEQEAQTAIFHNGLKSETVVQCSDKIPLFNELHEYKQLR